MYYHYICDINPIRISYSCMRKILTYLSILLAVSGCTRHSDLSALSQVDSLISAEKLDSALSVLDGIDTTSIRGEYNKAYYALLRTQLSYKLYLPDIDYRSIDQAANYFLSSTDDKRKQASALYYKAMLLYGQDRFSESVKTLKQAEEIASHGSDIDMNHKIYDSLMMINFASGNYSLALNYGHKSADCARRTGNSLWYAYAFNHLACVHNAIGNSDSAGIYYRKSLPYIENVSSEDQARILYTVGQYYHNRGESDIAAAYLQRSYQIAPIAPTCNLLADIYSRKGETEKADELWENALANSSQPERSSILDTLARRQRDNCRLEDAFKTMQHLVMLRDSIARQRQTSAVTEIQLKYDHQTAKRRFDRKLITALYILIAIIIVLTSVATYLIYRSGRMKSRMLSRQVLVDDYIRKIEELKKNGEDASKSISRLQAKIEKIQSEQTDKLFEGHRLYESLVANEPIVKWDKNDISKVIEYYKAVNLPFILSMENDYSGLTNGNRLFLILQHMNKTDVEMSHILGTSQGAIRTARYRLRSKER